MIPMPKTKFLAEVFVEKWKNEIIRFAQKLKKEEKEEFYSWLYYYTGFLMKFFIQKYNKEKTKHTAPFWFRKILRKFPASVSRIGRALDHCNFTDKAVIGEPYDLRFEDICAAVSFCLRHNLRLDISGTSPYFPGHTFKVVFTQDSRAKKNKKLLEMV